MVKITVLYEHPTNPDAFEQYYAETHGPLAMKIPHVTRLELARFTPNADGTPPAYYRMAELWYDDMARLQASLASAEFQAVSADMANFATGGAMLLVSETTQVK
ncbi:MAG TPA: EthD family reductase [Chloroflexota bacterium]|nr:EthD family reductase [Chloroflexota bacterium]